MIRTLCALVAAAQFLAAAGAAATLDFTSLASGNLGASVTVGGVTFEGNTALLNRSDTHFTDAGGAICAKRGSGPNCTGDMNIRFEGKVKKLRFNSAGYQAGDVATIVIYRGGEVVGSTGVASNGRIDLGIYKKITRIRIEYEGVEDGMAFGKFEFTPVTAALLKLDDPEPATLVRRSPPSRQAPSVVPVPAGLPLLAAALGLLGALRLRSGRPLRRC